MNIHPALPEEVKYTYAQSQQLMLQTGMYGYLRGDFGHGKEFFTTWWDENLRRVNDAFRTNLDETINALRFDSQYGGLLAGRNEMRRYCTEYPDADFSSESRMAYCFRVDSAKYTYLLRCTPAAGEYNFYCHCYETASLDRHISRARNGIRFINPLYQEQFRLTDGDKIRITTPEGERSDHTCRYIDEAHFELGSRGSLYHICEFAERMEQAGNKVIPLRSSLPEKCFGLLPSTSEVIEITKGEAGFQPMAQYPEGQDILDTLRALNDAIGVRPQQAAAMAAGAMFGWQTPAADPKNYNEDGLPLKPHTLDFAR